MDSNLVESPITRKKDLFKITPRLNNNNTSISLTDLSHDEMKDLGVGILTSETYDDFQGSESSCDEEAEVQTNKRSKITLEGYRVYHRPYCKPCQNGQDVLNWLSDEMVLGILRWLPRRELAKVSLVSRRLRALCLDESLWRRIDLNSRFLPTDTLGHVLRRGPRALRLAKSKIKEPIFSETKLALTGFISKLEYLDLSESTISSEDLCELLEKCRHLKKLSLEGCEVSERACSALALNPSLTTLNLALCSGLTAPGLTLVLQNCTRLESLNLGWTHLKSNVAASVCRHVSETIEEINLSGSYVSDADVEALVSRCVDLTELDVSDCWELTGEAVRSIVQHLALLRGLSLSRAFKIPHEALGLLRELPALERLNVFRCGSRAEPLCLSDFPGVRVNTELYSAIARPTTGDRRTSIWGVRFPPAH